MFDFLFREKKRLSVVGLILCVVFGQVISVLRPVATHAIPGDTVYVLNPSANMPAVGAGSPTYEVGSLPELKKEAKTSISDELYAAAMGALINSASYFLNKLAYDSAMNIAQGNWGKLPLADTETTANYFESLALDSVATFANDFASGFGVDLCTPANFDVSLFITIGLRRMYASGTPGGPTPSCKWQDLQLKQRFTAFGDLAEGTIGDPGAFFARSINIQESDFGIAMGAMARADRLVVSKQEGNMVDRIMGQGFKSFTDMVSGKILTPAIIFGEEAKGLTNKNQGQLTSNQISGVYAAKAWQIFPMAGSVFLNTLLSESLVQLQKKLLETSDSATEAFAGVLDYEEGGYTRTRKQMEEVFADLLAIKIGSVDNYGLVEEFLACPKGSVALPGLNNCVIDSDFAQALSEARSGKPLTIREAIKRGYLHGNWPLISPRRVIDNTNLNGEKGGCAQFGYCYSNIQKLRRARILPLGFEIAVNKADPDNPIQEGWTLENVVKNFDTCDWAGVDAKGNKIPKATQTGNNKFCRLIDPNWLITLPETRCNARVFSSNLMDTKTGLRAEECVDAPSCLSTDGSGNCNSFGYCTRERNIWKIGSDVCPAYYNTCKTYFGSDKQAVSYLSRTVDSLYCDAESVGCAPYSLEQNTDGTWVKSTATNQDLRNAGRPQVVYFNAKIKEDAARCSESDEGCSAFYGADLSGEIGDYDFSKNTATSFLRKAPDYLGCYDIIPSTSVVDWPMTKPQLLDLPQKEECGKFANACVPEEVGCDLFTPVLSGPTAIPGQYSSANKCAAECVGYNTFKQESNSFYGEEYPMYFIPANAKTCAAENVGCEEFTNLDAAANGGEKLEYYKSIKYCEKPNGLNKKIYYSWEGTAEEGFVLRTHEMKPVDSAYRDYIQGLADFGGDATSDVIAKIKADFPIGSPAYADDRGVSLKVDYDLCNEDAYNILINKDSVADGWSFGQASPGCRALYDSDGKIYYRLLSSVITVSDACHPLRKTKTELYTDTSLDNATKCEKYGGFWNTATSTVNPSVRCERCYGGGSYDKTSGTCVFNAIDATGESVSCSAEAAGCRAYTGNAANNIEQVSYDSFEDAGEDIFSGWRSMGASNSLTISTESTQVGMHSLRVPAGTSGDQISKEFEMGTINYLDQYQVSFWAKGNPQNLKLYFRQAGVSVGEFNYDLSSSETVYSPVSADWREYTLGPVYFRGDTYSTTTPVSLVIERTASGSGDPGDYYLDHIRLLHINGSVNLIADSWKTSDGYDVPVTCDQYPYDALPGTALGCAAYTNQAGEPVTVTGFERLCRMEAVGCQALYETKNTYANSEGDGLEADKVAYNVECRLNPTQFPAGQKHNLSFCSVTLDNTTYSCSLQNNITSCFIDEPIVINSPLEIVPNNGGLLTDGGAGFTIESFGSWYWLKELPASLYISPSTVVIAEDSGPIFLAGRSEYSCAESEVGCTRAALEHRILPGAGAGAMEYVETYIKNNPTNYKDTLCVERQSGCEAFTYSKNIQYFKDPQLTGGALCDYRAQSDESGKAGWYLRGVGQCSNSASAYCNSDDDCPTGGVCGTVGEVPCYSNYILPNGELGIWSNNTTQYENKVGVCEAEANGCTELIDPVDTADYPSGRPYYVIDNKKLQSRVTECGGKVSQKEGCVLFNQTEQPKLSYDAAASYKLSDAKLGEDDKLVSPVSTDANSANLILKVDRERECGEWLSCRGSMPVLDSQTGKMRSACYAIQLCREGSQEKCTRTAEYDNQFMFHTLQYEDYIHRDVTWSNGREFSGYSIYEQYSPAALSLISSEDKSYRSATSSFTYYLGHVNLAAQDECIDNAEVSNGETCGVGGICWNNSCINLPKTIGIEDGSLTTTTLFKNYLFSPECRGYPEETSPFRNTVVEKWNPSTAHEYKEMWKPESLKPGFSSANLCVYGEDKKEEDCDCNYVKIEYKGGSIGSKYFAYNSDHDALLKDGLCSSNNPKVEGKSCNGDDECLVPPLTSDDIKKGATTSTCIYKEKVSKNLGWKGYCLEYDESHKVNGYGFAESELPDRFMYPCLTWYPVDYLPINEADIYFNNDAIGYLPSDGRDNVTYCAEATAANVSYSTDKKLDFSENRNIHWWGMVSLDCAGIGFGSCDAYDSDGNFVPSTDPNWEDDFVDEWLFNYDSRDWWGVLDNTGETVLKCLDNQSKDLRKEFVCNIPATDKGFPNADYCYDAYLKKQDHGNIFPQNFSASFQCTDGELDPFSISGACDTYDPLEFGDYLSDTQCLYERVSHFGFDFDYFQNVILSYLSRTLPDGGYIQPFVVEGCGTSDPGCDDDEDFMFRGLAENVNNYEYISRVDSFKSFNPTVANGAVNYASNSGAGFRDGNGCNGNDYYGDSDQGFTNNAGLLCHAKLMSSILSAYAYPNDPKSYQVPFFPTIRGVMFKPIILETNKAGENDVYYLSTPGEQDDQYDSGIINQNASEFEKEINMYTNDSVSIIIDSSFGTKEIEVVDFRKIDAENQGELVAEEGKSFVRKSIEGDVVSYVWQIWVAIPNKFGNQFEINSANEQAIAMTEADFGKHSPTGVVCGDSGCKPVISISGADENLNSADFLALEFRFNATTGKFLGYRSRSRNMIHKYPDSDKDSFVGTIISWHTVPMCYKAVSVYDVSGNQNYTNKAWTDRVWSSAGVSRDYFDGSLNFSEPMEPFGAGNTSLGITKSSPSNMSRKPWLFGAFQDGLEWAGFPWACNSVLSNGDCLVGGAGSLDLPTISGASNKMDDRRWDDFDSKLSKPGVVKHVTELFAAPINVVNFGYDPNSGEYGWVNTGKKYEKSDPALVAGKPPHIFPAVKCDGAKCDIDRSKVDQFAVNGIDKLGADPKLFAYDTYLAQLQFFAWADHNQMPIRRIKVNWNDKVVPAGDTGNLISDQSLKSGDQRGYFPNFKPKCDTATAEPTYECVWHSSDEGDVYSGLSCDIENGNDDCSALAGGNSYDFKCEDVGARFGNRPESCVNYPVVRNFNYSCQVEGMFIDGNIGLQPSAPKNIIAVGALIGRLTSPDYSLSADAAKEWYNYLRNVRNFEDSDFVCVYQPKVQVLDNWGWCTGSCKMTGSGGCYNGDIGENVKQCEESGDPSMIYGKEWVRFQNVIIVAPNRK